MLEAAKHCECMATELLALASSIEGADRLLTALDLRQMPLFDVLVEQEQKEVISHPAVQRYLQVPKCFKMLKISNLPFFFNTQVKSFMHRMFGWEDYNGHHGSYFCSSSVVSLCRPSG